MPQPRGAHLLISDKSTFSLSALRLRLSDFSGGLYLRIGWSEELTSAVRNDLRILRTQKYVKKLRLQNLRP